MSKMIKLPQDILDQYTKEFYETLRSGKFPDGKVNFSKTLGTVDRKATVLFTELAWQKMQLLIREFNDEVAWHGIATRCEEKDTLFLIFWCIHRRLQELLLLQIRKNIRCG